jgi:hypothetical protein
MRNDTAIETTMLNVRGFRMYVALEQGAVRKSRWPPSSIPFSRIIANKEIPCQIR